MSRFHQSMSWDQPNNPAGSSSGEPGSEDSDSEHQAWDSWTDSGESGDENGFDHQAFVSEQDPPAPWTGHRNFFLPVHYTPSYEYPLIVWLHNDGFNENQIDHVMPHISLRNYVGVGIRGTKATDSVGHRFAWHSSPGAINLAHNSVIDAIEEARERFSIKPSRILLGGYHAGGTMALRIAMREPNRFAGAFSLGGRMPQGAIRNLQQLRHARLPMLWQWASSREEFTSELLKLDCQSAMSIGSQVEVRQYPGDDEMDTVVLRDVDDWIMRRIVSTSSSGATSDRWATSPTAYSAN